MALRIVRFSPGALDPPIGVAEDVFDAAIDPARLAAFSAADAQLMVLAVLDDTVVGQARAVVHLQPDGGSGLYVDNLGVTPGRQRQGVGLQLMEALFVWGRERGCDHAWVATETDNTPAIKLYESLGGTLQTMTYLEFDLTSEGSAEGDFGERRQSG